jgi:hypothetical protein
MKGEQGRDMRRVRVHHELLADVGERQIMRS